MPSSSCRFRHEPGEIKSAIRGDPGTSAALRPVVSEMVTPLDRCCHAALPTATAPTSFGIGGEKNRVVRLGHQHPRLAGTCEGNRHGFAGAFGGDMQFQP